VQMSRAMPVSLWANECRQTLDRRLADGQTRRMNRQSDTTMARFLESYQEHADALRRFLYPRVPAHTVDDLFQDVWMRAWEHWDDFDGRNLRAWLFQIARNRIIDSWRSPHSHTQELPQDAAVAQRDPTSDALVEQEHADRLAVCLEKLPKEFREVFEANTGGEAVEETAIRLQIQRTTVYTRLHRARQLLLDCVNGISA
jgi:RNA polymerase sigma-70 factor, ECF subfamily